MAEQPEVRVGQVWADNDRRQEDKRVLKVVGFEKKQARVWRASRMAYETVTDRFALVQRLVDGQLVGPQRRIRVDRFRPTSTGYRLVEDVPAEAAR